MSGSFRQSLYGLCMGWIYSLYSFVGIVHVALCCVLGVFIIFQKSSGEGLVATGNKSQFMSGSEVAKFVLKATWLIAGLFFANCLVIMWCGAKIAKTSNLTLQVDTSSNEKN